MAYDEKKKGKEVEESVELQQASVADVFSFADSFSTKAYFSVGAIFAFLNGMVYPGIAYMFSTSFTSITGASEADGLDKVNDVAYKFLFIGTYAMACATFQTGLMEIASMKATHSFRTQWFAALLRQDQAYFDINDISGIANQIIPNANKVRRGLGRKLGEGIQFTTTCVFGLIYAFYTSWRVSLVVLAVLPFVSFAAFMTLKINQGVTARANEAYSEAGSVAYSTVSSIKTVLSLNAIPKMVKQYCDATEKAHCAVVDMLWKAGFTNASLLGTFICLYIALTLYGVSLLYEDVRENGCDPSGAVDGLETCGTSSSDVFGAMLGIAFAGQGISQVGNFFENFAAARVACYPAMQAINRHAKEKASTVAVSRNAPDVPDVESAEEGTRNKIILGDYVIDSSSSNGLKPSSCQGEILIKDVSFSYPTRPGNLVFQNFNLEVKAGTTVALVGPSGGGKSTTVSLIERFYDPINGSVYLDGNNLRDINVKHLRNQIGLVSQEPVLFATTISANIAYGCPGATQDEIEEAARQANAHDFIMSFPDGYSTQAGDKGAQLSGGQKQRIAIARILIKQPKILLLDEATSALDTESEIIVQEALDNLLSASKRTTIVIAHRLSTIRNADVIAYIADGKVLEQGTHEELMVSEIGLYRSLVEKADNSKAEVGSANVSREASVNNLASLAPIEIDNVPLQLKFTDVSFAYPTRPSKLIFDNFNLSVRRGETLALVGPSGQGKSTAVSLVERFYDPLKGAIEFNGTDIREINVRWLRDQMSLVGQEPVLFSGSIGDNIAYGFPGATQALIEEAARNANAHEFVMSFKDGYDTFIGERGTQLSGGQKQRIAIARALVKDPKLLLLDESTSALDTSSEKIVQDALEKVMASHDRTTIVIAHRLSTIRNADRIAFIAGGRVKEIGTHDYLMNIPNGRYARYVESQKIRSSVTATSVKELSDEQENKSSEHVENDEKIVDPSQEEKSLAKKARSLASDDLQFLLIGSFGAIGAGLVFPLWGIMFAFMIDLLFQSPEPCEEDSVQQDLGFKTCADYYDDKADEMKDRSFVLALYWAGLVCICYAGNMLTFYGYGQASERMSKRVRDSAFEALVRQEVAYFDKRSVGSITTQLQDDTSLIHSFSGEPLRTLFINIASLVTGLVVSFIYMWPFALLSVGVIPFMGFATEIEMKTFLGADEGDANRVSIEGLNSPGGILVETLLNIKTVASLNLEKERYSDYCRSLTANEPTRVFVALKAGSTSGLSMLVQQYVNALQFWWGGYLLYHYPESFDFQGFLISMFSLLFSLFGLGAAAMGTTDKKKASKAASRIFDLLERDSAIDPLGEGGKKSL